MLPNAHGMYSTYKPNIYGNTATVYAKGTNIFGFVVAWVKSEWTFGINGNTGKFILNNQDTFLTLDSGGTWPDGGNWKGTQSSTSSTALDFSGEFSLDSPFNGLSGTMYNNVVYHPDDGSYSWYRGIYGVDLHMESLPFPPIDVEFDA